MPNYIVHAHGRTAFPDLAMVDDGIVHTLEADPGDVVRLAESCDEAVIKHFIERGVLEATAKPVPKKKPAPKVDEAEIAATREVVKAAVAEQAGSDRPADS